MQDETIPVGLCQCGCGRKTELATVTNAKYGRVKGQPSRFVNGHNSRARGVPACGYVVEDRGYHTPCWIWKLRINACGYGQVRRGDRPGLGAHVVENTRRGARAKLTPAIVLAIRASEHATSALAEQYGVSATAVRLARQGKTWRNIEEPSP